MILIATLLPIYLLPISPYGHRWFFLGADYLLRMVLRSNPGGQVSGVGKNKQLFLKFIPTTKTSHGRSTLGKGNL